MNGNGEVKSGFLSSEGILTTVHLVFGMLVATGVVTQTDGSTLEGAVIKCVGAAATLAASAWVIVQYVKGRSQVKAKALEAAAVEKVVVTAPAVAPSGTDVLARSVLPLLMLLAFGSVAGAADTKTCVIVGVGRHRCPPPAPAPAPQIIQAPPAQTDPALSAALIAALNAQRVQAAPQTGPMIHYHYHYYQQAAPVAPVTPVAPVVPQVIPAPIAGPLVLAAPPPILVQPPQQVLPINHPPQQILPINAPPQQVLPIQQPPQQILPIAAPPQQVLPIAAPPQQVLPILQAPPQQQLPVAPPLPIPVPVPAPSPVAPVVPPPTSPPVQPLSPQVGPQQQLLMAPPSGYQRYTQVQWRRVQ